MTSDSSSLDALLEDDHTTDPEAPSEPPGTEPPAQEEQEDKRRRKLLWWLVFLLALLLIIGAIFLWYGRTRKPLQDLVPGVDLNKVPHYELSIYGVEKPTGVAVTPDGDRVYVTDTGELSKVVVFDADGKKVGTLTPPSANKGSHLPLYVAINPVTDDVYVTDRLYNAIYVYDASGKYLETFDPGDEVGKEFQPLGLAFGPDGSLYVTDVRGTKPKDHRVVVFGPDGSFDREIAAGQLNFPNCMVVNDQGQLFLADSNNGRLVVFDDRDQQGSVIQRGLGDGDLGLPRGVGLDSDGRLYVVDTTDHQVRVYQTHDSATDAPEYIGSFGGQGNQDGQFQFPNGLAVDKRARVYVTDRENNRLQIWGY